MSKLKLGDIRDDKPVKLTIELPAQVHRDLTADESSKGRVIVFWKPCQRKRSWLTITPNGNIGDIRVGNPSTVLVDKCDAQPQTDQTHDLFATQPISVNEF